jgi:5-methylcytosine-specific restriction endonuclease McrA
MHAKARFFSAKRIDIFDFIKVIINHRIKENVVLLKNRNTVYIKSSLALLLLNEKLRRVEISPPKIKVVFRQKERYKIQSFKRKNIDTNRCGYCNCLLNPDNINTKSPLSRFNKTVDHFVPLVKGGNSNHENLVICCAQCNQIKA